MDPSQLPLVRGVAARAGLHIAAVGSNERARGRGGGRELAEALATDQSAPPTAVDDLRSALATTDAQLVLLAAPGDFAAAPSSAEADAAVLAEAVKRGLRILTLEPLPASVLQLGTAGVMSSSGIWGGGRSGGGGLSDAGVVGPAGRTGAGWGAAEWARFLPMMRDIPPMRDLADLAESFGQVQSVCLRMVGRPSHGSVGARLYDASALLIALLGMPDQAYAAYVGRLTAWPPHAPHAPHAGNSTAAGEHHTAAAGPSTGGTSAGGSVAGRGLRPLPGDSLRGLAGDIAATLRYADGRAASVFVSDRAGEFRRSLTLVGERGTLAVSDLGLRWLDELGREVDTSRPDESFPAPPADPAEELIAREIRRAIDPTGAAAASTSPPVDAVRVLAVAGAVLLSARTGEVESPSTVLRMAGVG